MRSSRKIASQAWAFYRGTAAVGRAIVNISSPLIRLRSVLITGTFALIFAGFLPAQVNVLTSRYDNGRTGLSPNESFLNPANVRSATFGKLGSYNVDGYVVAQPLYMQNVSIGGASHNVVFIATQHDSLYAFDADNLTSGSPLWQRSFINSGAGITTVPITDQGCSVVNGYTEMGIQGTPVIDPSTSTLYVDVKTKEVVGSNTSYVHRLHAVDITSGLDTIKAVTIAGSVQGAHGTVLFDSAKGCQRSGLLLSNGTVYVGFGSNGCDTSRGWVFAYDATNLAQKGVFSTSPNQPRGANVWQGGAGLVADQSGNVFFITANGPFNVNTGGSDFGDSFVKLTLSGNVLNWSDYFTPYDQAYMTANDLDLGSGGIMLLTNPNVLIGAGKTGSIYVVNPNNMGGFNTNSNNDQIIQWLQSVLLEVDGTPAYWNGTVYFAPDHGPASAYAIYSNGLLSTLPIAQSQPITSVGGPILSANGPGNGIMWLLRNFGTSAKQLSAFDAISMAEIYNSTVAGARDTLGDTAHFVVPTVASGKVFVGTKTQLVIYGLMPAISSVSGGNQTGQAGSTLPLPLTVRVTDPYTSAPLVGVTVTFTGKGGSFANPTPVTDSTGTASTTYTLPTTFTSSSLTITVSGTGFASTSFVETITAGSPTSLALSSGGSQSGTAGTTLSKAIVFKLADQYGNGVPGITVTFSDSPNHGSFSSNSVTTDSLGKATVTYTLPTKAGFTTITASGAGFNASGQERALAGSPTSLSIVSGNNQTAPRNTLLPQQLKVKVTDQYGNGVAGVSVNYNDNGANGSFSSTTAITNSSGVAAVSYTTPGSPGTVTITATVNGLQVTFTVQVT